MALVPSQLMMAFPNWSNRGRKVTCRSKKPKSERFKTKGFKLVRNGAMVHILDTNADAEQLVKGSATLQHLLTG